MNRFVLCSCLLLTATTSLVELGWARTPSASNDRGKRDAESASQLSVRLPVRLYGGYLVIAEGAIGNTHKLNFLVDTGACPSVVDQKIAHDLKLAEQPERVNLWNKSVQARQVVLPFLSLGPVRVESIPVLAEDLSFLQKALGFKVHAIVGMDVLRKSSFTINYKTKEILFGTPEKLTHSVPFETDTPVVTVRMGFQDRRLRMVVDSGGPDLTLLRSRVPEPNGLQALGTETVADAGGTFQRTKVRIPELHMGKETMGAQTAFLVDDRKDDGDDFDGALGVRGLQFWKLAFDFENRRFSWELTAHVQLPSNGEHESSPGP
jgi:predicted aspartyl protease